MIVFKQVKINYIIFKRCSVHLWCCWRYQIVNRLPLKLENMKLRIWAILPIQYCNCSVKLCSLCCFCWMTKRIKKKKNLGEQKGLFRWITCWSSGGSTFHRLPYWGWVGVLGWSVSSPRVVHLWLSLAEYRAASLEWSSHIRAKHEPPNDDMPVTSNLQVS